MRLFSQKIDSMRHRLKYRRDPEFRAERIRKSREYEIRECREFPVYAEIMKRRKRIYGIREALNRLLLKQAAQERKLLRLTQELEKLIQGWKRQKQAKARRSAA